jgi:HAMP domain-containing protein
VRGRLTLSLRNRLALVFFAVTLLAIGVLYVYVAPGLQRRLLDDKLSQLSESALLHSGPINDTVGTAFPASFVRATVQRAALMSGDRVTLLAVNRAQGTLQLYTQADSSNPNTAGHLSFPVAYRSIATGKVETGTEGTPSGLVAEAAYPIHLQALVTAVVVYSAQVSDIARNVTTVRHEILVAGGIALLLALVAGYLVARMLAQRVKRLELAAKQVASGDFGHPIPVDSNDELGQLAIAFNEM